MGFGTIFSIAGQYTPAHCANECSGSMNLSGTYSATLNMCSDALKLSGVASYSGTSESCAECNVETCRQECKSGTCDSHTFGAQGSVTFSRFYGYQSKQKSGPVSVEVKCGATLSGTPSLGASGTKVNDNGFECLNGDCTECLSSKVTVGFGVAGAVDCFIGLNFWDGWVTRAIGCKNCGTIEVNAYGGGGGQVGECGGSLCAFAGAGINATASTPCLNISVGWIGFSARCSATASACAEANNCGNCTCKNCASATTSVSCSVNMSGQCE
jgi:hypothetical protein